MSIRVLLCFIFVIGFAIYAWKNWFPSLCAALVLMAVLEHPDMPNSIGGIQGLNPWNILMANVVLAWWHQRKGEGLVWDMPPLIQKLVLAFLGIILIGFVRLLMDIPPGVGVAYAVSEYLINTIKWVIPGILLFDGCRTKTRALTAIFSILLIYFLLAVQVIKWMPLGAIKGGASLSARASKITQKEIGYNRVTLSMMLAGASWATLSTLLFIKKRIYQLGIVGCAAAILLAQALTGGRTGYGTWVAVGLLFSVLRWKKLLVLIPITVAVALTFLPAVRERLMQGISFGGNSVVVRDNDAYEMTSGRNIAWPLVIAKIQESPLFGYGREAMVTSGIKDHLWEEYQESFPHPHQAYLQLALDNGILAAAVITFLYFYLFYKGVTLLKDKTDPVVSAVGGMCASLVFALLIGAFGGQTFYPREGMVGMWAAIGLMLRMGISLKDHYLTGEPIFPEDENYLAYQTESIPTIQCNI